MRKGEKDAYKDLEKLDKTKETYWFHCASLGEFEQARNLIETIKEKRPEIQVLVTFFSPSGYEIRKNYKFANLVTYLPLDTKRNAIKIVKMINPQMTFFIKYELWFNYMLALKGRHFYSVSLILRENHYIFKTFSHWFLSNLSCFEHFFVQDNATGTLLKNHGYNNFTITGDTRFDRVWKMSKEEKNFPKIESWCSGKQIFLAGSSWPEDEKIIKESKLAIENDSSLQNQNIKFILAPHLIDKHHIEEIQHNFPNSVLFSELENNDKASGADTLIIDCIGILMYLYKLCTIAYIGGGFGTGIHNILEAAVFAKPIAFGTNNKKFKEAQDLLSIKGAEEIKQSKDLTKWIKSLLTNADYYKKTAQICGNYVTSNVGATKKILQHIQIK